jgi:hypothetical protein
MTSHKAIAWTMLIFAVVSWPLLKLVGLSDTVVVIILSEVALAYPSILAIWFAKQEGDDAG